MADRTNLVRRTLLALYFAVAFFVFLFLLFPFDRVKTKLESEVRLRTPLELSIARISPRFFNVFVLDDVVLSDRKGTVLFESARVRAALSLFNLLRGVVSADLRVRAYGGDLTIKAQQGAGRQSFSVDADGLDVGSYDYLKTAGLKLSGILGGNFEMTGDTGRGKLWLKGLTSRDLKVQGFPVPDLDFEQGWIEADLKGDRLTIRKLDLDGKDLKIRCLGDVVLRERGTITLTVKLKPSEKLAREQAGLLSFLKNRDAEGFYQFGLGGTLTEPIPRF